VPTPGTPTRETLARPTNLIGAGGVAQLAERYVRNVEAEGSSPFTSTKSPRHRVEVGSPKLTPFIHVTLRDLIGEESAYERYVSRCRGRSPATPTP
jgi:hypothetical protein